MIIVNFKRYLEASGQNAVVLASICHKLSLEYSLPIIAVPTVADLAACLATGAECWTQKFEQDAVSATGTLLNHSDYRLETSILALQISQCRDRNYKICLCSANPDEVPELLNLRPDMLAYEPPALIGSKTSSVAQAEPNIIGDIAQIAKTAGISLLVGAGIKSALDIKVSLNQGAVGILVATDVVKADNQEQALRELVDGFRSLR